MTQDDAGYDLTPKPPEEKPASGGGWEGLKPGEPGFVPPVPVVEKASVDEATEEASEIDPDVEHHKILAIVAYILFFVPLIAAPESKFARYHANQGLLLFILMVASMFGVSLLEVAILLLPHVLGDWILPWFLSCIFHLLQFGLLLGGVALAIVGILNAANGLKKPLPGIGHWTLIK